MHSSPWLYCAIATVSRSKANTVPSPPACLQLATYSSTRAKYSSPVPSAASSSGSSPLPSGRGKPAATSSPNTCRSRSRKQRLTYASSSTNSMQTGLVLTERMRRTGKMSSGESTTRVSSAEQGTFQRTAPTLKKSGLLPLRFNSL